MRYFFIEPSEISGATSIITGSDARHIKTVLRLKPGDKIGLFDGTGMEYRAEIIDFSPECITVSITDRFPSTSESPVRIIIAQGFLKEKKMDVLVRQLSELGVSKWIPFFAQRSVSRPDKKQISIRTQRWKKIAKESLKQCRRGRVMEIGDTVSYEEMLDLGEPLDLKIVFWENEFQLVDAKLSKPNRQIHRIFAVLGPEGGLTNREIESARNRGFATVGLGPRILRAETATAAACVLMQYLFGDMNQKNLDKKKEV
jgi:16S rRNA (uracil1498-N3)-methyltransferase